ncbi:MAG: alpha/beta hydrolase-fold protein [Alphaproteobacteria bacterium]|nr:alpha/beta hydrolase-fold protein [Alphaproteobacteria bacterium]
MIRRALVAALFSAGLGLSGGQAGEITRDLSLDVAGLNAPVPYWVYRPDGVPAETPLPVIYLLHGYNAGPGAWFHAAGLEAAADRLIAEGAIPPALIVLPKLGNSWYVDSEAFGPVATRFVDTFIPAVEARHGGIGDRRSRAVAGISMGGFGALRLAYHHPESFVATAALSPAIVSDVDHAWRLGKAQIGLFGPVFGDPLDPNRLRAANVFSPLDRLALMEDPPASYITTGDDDYFELWRGASHLFLALRDRGLPVEMRITDGGHVWPLWKRELANVLRFLGDRIDPE